MPNTRSAEKRLRSSNHHRGLNRMRKLAVKTAKKDLEAKLEASDFDGAREALCTCFAALDKAAKKGAIHKNTANRQKSRLSIKIARLEKNAAS